MYCVSCGTPIEQNDLNILICPSCALKVLSYHLSKKQENTISETSPDKFKELAVSFDLLKELGDINTPEPPLITTNENNDNIEPEEPDKLGLIILICFLVLSIFLPLIFYLFSL